MVGHELPRTSPTQDTHGETVSAGMRPPLTVSPTMRGVRAVPAVMPLAAACWAVLAPARALGRAPQLSHGQRHLACFCAAAPGLLAVGSSSSPVRAAGAAWGQSAACAPPPGRRVQTCAWGGGSAEPPPHRRLLALCGGGGGRQAGVSQGDRDRAEDATSPVCVHVLWPACIPRVSVFCIPSANPLCAARAPRDPLSVTTRT
jgi:hypothetical protein